MSDSKYPPARTRFLIYGGKALQDGEKTEALRVRGPVDALEWARTLTPSERGDVFAAALAARSKPKPIPPKPLRWGK